MRNYRMNFIANVICSFLIFAITVSMANPIRIIIGGLSFVFISIPSLIYIYQYYDNEKIKKRKLSDIFSIFLWSVFLLMILNFLNINSIILNLNILKVSMNAKILEIIILFIISVYIMGSAFAENVGKVKSYIYCILIKIVILLFLFFFPLLLDDLNIAMSISTTAITLWIKQMYSLFFDWLFINTLSMEDVITKRKVRVLVIAASFIGFYVSTILL